MGLKTDIKHITSVIKLIPREKIISLIFAMLFAICGYVIIYVFFGWKLTLAIFLIIWGNNISQSLNK